MTSTVLPKPTSTAGALFNDQSFSFEALRALGYAVYGGADIGEVASTASRIPDGDLTAWYSEWRALAERVHADADRSAAAGHPVSARESYLRASNYYRLCEFYLCVDSSNDPEIREVGQLSVASFAGAAQLMNPAPQRIRFPYEDTTLPGWWIPADPGTSHPTGGDPDGPRPTLLFHGGFDSTEAELYFCGGAAAARRGYQVLAFAGPGQGSALRDQKLFFRPDWDAVVTPAVNWLLARPDVDPDRIALMGMSFGDTSPPVPPPPSTVWPPSSPTTACTHSPTACTAASGPRSWHSSATSSSQATRRLMPSWRSSRTPKPRRSGRSSRGACGSSE